MKTWHKLLAVLLLAATAGGGLYLLEPAAELPAAFTAETKVCLPEAPAVRTYGESIIEEAEPWPAPLTENELPGPVVTLRREVTVETASGSLTLPAGSPCYLLQAWADGTRHLLANEWGSFLVSSQAVDGREAGIVYEFSPDQDMRLPTGFSGEELERCLSGGLSGLGEDFARAEEVYGVNALFMIAIAQHESGNGESGLATEQNNLIGLRSGSGWASFGSLSECVDYLGDYLANSYLSPGTSYYHGSTIAGVSVTYCGGSQDWINHIVNYMEQDLALVRGW